MLLRVAFVVVLMVVAIVAARAEQRVAFVVGNAEYRHASQLVNPVNDANDMTETLAQLGFDVVKGTNLTTQNFLQKLLVFREKLKSADVALLFYSGHGIAVNGINYLIPVDARMESTNELEVEAIPLTRIQNLMESRPRLNIILFDACRHDPFNRKIQGSSGTRSVAVARGWVPVASQRETYISFATKPGDVASDGTGRNSPFTKALLQRIGNDNRDIQLVMRDVRKSVIDATGGNQVPWERSSMTSSFVFASRGGNLPSKAVWLTASKKSFQIGEKIELLLKPPKDCRLTLLNTDTRGNSCLLFPHPGLPDQPLKANVTVRFPPRGSLTLAQAGDETFIALCNASKVAKAAETRKTRHINCSKGTGDRLFNNTLLETVVFDLNDDNGASSARRAKQEVLRSTLTVTVSEQQPQ